MLESPRSDSLHAHSPPLHGTSPRNSDGCWNYPGRFHICSAFGNHSLGPFHSRINAGLAGRRSAHLLWRNGLRRTFLLIPTNGRHLRISQADFFASTRFSLGLGHVLEHALRDHRCHRRNPRSLCRLFCSSHGARHPRAGDLRNSSALRGQLPGSKTRQRSAINLNGRQTRRNPFRSVPDFLVRRTSAPRSVCKRSHKRVNARLTQRIRPRHSGRIICFRRMAHGHLHRGWACPAG